MRIHWTETRAAREEIRTLAEEDVSRALLDRLMARIARREGRGRPRTKPTRPTEPVPTFPEAA
jgi:hypothetical protein